MKSLQIIDIVGVRDVPVWSKYQFFKKVLHRFLRRYVIFFFLQGEATINFKWPPPNKKRGINWYLSSPVGTIQSPMEF